MDKEKLIKHIDYYLGGSQPSHYSDNGLYTKEGVIYAIRDFDDEAEVLSQEWIDENGKLGSFQHGGGIDFDRFVKVRDLQNLLVPKQEELESKIKALIKAYEQEDGRYSNLENAWISGFIGDLEGLVEEQKYYVLGKHDTPILFKDYKNRTTESSNLSDIYPKANSEDFEFTEKEIKDYDERYIPFMVPVDEVNND